MLCATQRLLKQFYDMQDEAKRALQSLFQGKKDSLSAYDVKPESGGGGKGGGGRGKKGLGGDGDGSSSWQPPDLRQLSINAWNRLGRSLRALLAVLGFVGTFPFPTQHS